MSTAGATHMIKLIKADKTSHGPFECIEDAAAYIRGAVYYLSTETVITARDGTTYMLMADNTFRECAWKSAARYTNHEAREA